MSPTDLPFGGPRRLILIQSGKYDYAELDLTRPFQLVGVNGLGKTALISTLQYLYLDSQSDMRFGQHTTAESRKFYFRGDSSFILFECDTTAGTVVVGARGLGAAGGHELQRFSWTGGYRREDFITPEGRARTWDEIKTDLAVNGLRVLNEAAELRGLLGAVDTDTDASWGIVPLADASDYRRFRQTFQRLLQLRDIRQDDLKQLLADCAKLGPSQREIDLTKEFSKELERIERDRNEVRKLTLARPAVLEVRKLHDEEYVARAIAHAVVRELNTRHAGYAAEYKRAVDALIQVRDASLAKHKLLEDEQAGLQKASRETNEQAGAFRERLRFIEEGKTRFGDFVPEVEQAALEALGTRVAELTVRLQNVPAESRATLERQLTETQENLRQREQSLRHIDRLFITWLRGHFPEEDAARIGALLERGILEAPLDQGVSVLDENALLARLRVIVENSDARGYRDPAVEIEFSAGALPRLRQIGRKEGLLEEIRTLTRRAGQLERDIETLANTAALKEEFAKVKADYRTQGERLSAYARYREAQAEEQSIRHNLRDLEQESERLTGELGKNEVARKKIHDESQMAFDKLDLLKTENEVVRREERDMPVAPGEPVGRTAVSDAVVEQLMPPVSLPEVFKAARDRCREARARAQQLEDKSSLLDRDFMQSSFRYDVGAPLEDRLAVLETEIAALEERSRQIENHWAAILIEARNGFSTILKSLATVTKQARKLTGELAKIEFSSISQVRLEVVPNAAAVSEYERHAKDALQPSLFDTEEEADNKLSQFHALLQRRPRLVLHDLFSLKCDVVRKDGVKNSYDDFDQVESTGTTIVLKVTLNLLVLRDLLIPGKARIPFYLDEVHALDRQNFNNILQLSENLGFVGIYAAPTAAIGPRRFVHLVPDAKGRLVVTAAHRKDIVRTPDENIPA